MIQQTINVQISTEDQRRLPEANRPILFICNRQEKGWDERVLETILRPRYPNLTVLSIAKSQNPFLRVQEAIAERNFQLLVKLLKETLEKQTHPQIALPIGADTFVPHFLRCFGKWHTDVTIAFGQPIYGDDAEVLAQKAQDWINLELAYNHCGAGKK